jgi:predicted DsbA family dithiol-disulfide isomerase
MIRGSEEMLMLSIDIVSDVICPWCFIGVRRLDQAIETLAEGIDTKVAFQPFLLDPGTPAGGADLRERLRVKYGVDPESMFHRVEAAAHESGIPLDFSKVTRTPSTIAAHTLLGHALEKGTQRALAGALFEAYFLEGRDVGDARVLGDIAASHGFERDEAIRLATDATELAHTRAAAATAAARGVRGVPFFVFGGRVTVSGAQSKEVLRGAIEKAALSME